MPEGDTIHRIAANLAPRITGQTLERVTTQGLVRDLAGRTVQAVLAHGKHLVIDLDGGVQLRMHLGMNGKVRMYGRQDGEAVLARTSPGRVSLALVTADGVYLWLTAPTVEISNRRDPRRGMAVASLGPDILDDDFDTAIAAGRAAAARASRSIAEALLDQTIVAGIGNVYKSEALFVARLDPRTPTGALSAEQLAALFAIARKQMLANLGPAPRTTRAALTGAPKDTRYFVYGRSGKPCITCSTPVACISQGDDPPRWTWYCPTCQRPAA